MRQTSTQDEESNEHRTKARTEARVVVTGSSPSWKAILKKVVISFPPRSSQDIGNNTKAGKAIASLLDLITNLVL